jgi:hypothetical protein
LVHRQSSDAIASATEGGHEARERPYGHLPPVVFRKEVRPALSLRHHRARVVELGPKLRIVEGVEGDNDVTVLAPRGRAYTGRQKQHDREERGQRSPDGLRGLSRRPPAIVLAVCKQAFFVQQWISRGVRTCLREYLPYRQQRPAGVALCCRAAHGIEATTVRAALVRARSLTYGAVGSRGWGDVR